MMKDCQSLIGWWFCVTHGDFAMAKCKKSPDLVGGLEYDFYFPFHVWYVILPIDELRHFSGG